MGLSMTMRLSEGRSDILYVATTPRLHLHAKGEREHRGQHTKIHRIHGTINRPRGEGGGGLNGKTHYVTRHNMI